MWKGKRKFSALGSDEAIDVDSSTSPQRRSSPIIKEERQGDAAPASQGGGKTISLDVSHNATEEIGVSSDEDDDVIKNESVDDTVAKKEKAKRLHEIRRASFRKLKEQHKKTALHSHRVAESPRSPSLGTTAERHSKKLKRSGVAEEHLNLPNFPQETDKNIDETEMELRSKFENVRSGIAALASANPSDVLIGAQLQALDNQELVRRRCRLEDIERTEEIEREERATAKEKKSKHRNPDDLFVGVDEYMSEFEHDSECDDTDDESETDSTRSTETQTNKSTASKRLQIGAKLKPKKIAKKRKHQPDHDNLASLLNSDFLTNALDVANSETRPAIAANLKTRSRLEAINSILAHSANAAAAKADAEKVDDAIRSFVGQGSSVYTGSILNSWRVKGIKVEMRPHQIIGAGFMRQRERGPDEPHGGIMADEMGLGKTVQTLASIVNEHPAKLAQKRVRNTLIVVPPSIASQWVSEIQKFCEEDYIGPQVLELYGVNLNRMLRRNEDLDKAIRKHPIIVTTYPTVRRSFPSAKIPLELTTAKQKSDWWREHFDEHRGVLHRTRFRRIIFDECSEIKNHRSLVSIACRKLKADFHWLLSGTPIYNSLEELYTPFRILRIPGAESIDNFRHNFIGARNIGPDDLKSDDFDPTSINRLKTWLQKIMIRREINDQLFGEVLVDLPNMQHETRFVEFTSFERVIYELVKKRMVQRINQMSRDNDLERNYSCILVMILRLRQICNHVLSVQPVLGDLLDLGDLLKLKDMADEELKPCHDVERRDTMLALRKMFHQEQMRRLSQQDDTGRANGARGGTTAPSEDNSTSSKAKRARKINTDPKSMTISDELGNDHGLHFEFHKYIATLFTEQQYEQMQGRIHCVLCGANPSDPWVTKCRHVYCRKCLEKDMHLAADRDQDRTSCHFCGKVFVTAEPCGNFDLESLRNLRVSSSSSQRKGKGNADKDDSDDDALDWLSQGEDVLPSAKTVAIKALILNWFQETPDIKIVVFTQFQAVIKILSKLCIEERWKFSTLHGKKNFKQRDKVLQDFRDPKKGVRILIASLKCGGVGLNLTCASRVIVVDPWWNSAVSQQAFARVYRIGQDRECRMVQLAIKGPSVDANIIELQDKKLKVIRGVLDAERMKLSTGELMSLFGRTNKDAKGRFIIVEDADESQAEQDVSNDDESDAGSVLEAFESSNDPTSHHIFQSRFKELSKLAN